MMINKKNCSLIVLLVLLALPRDSRSITPRLTKRSTDDGACEQSTAVFCSKIINDENGLLQRFSPDTSHQIQKHFENATANCKVLLCVMTMYAVLTEGEKYFPNSPFINDEAFVNVIKANSLAECKNVYSPYDSQSEKIIDNSLYSTTDDASSLDFRHFETTSAQQSINSNEIDGSLNESKHEPRKGIIDILYTNENYTNAAKSKDMKEQTNTKLVGYNPKVENVTVVKLDNVETKDSGSTPPIIYSSDDSERSELDVANRILGASETTAVANDDIVSNSEFVFVSSFTTSTVDPLDLAEVKFDGVTPNFESSEYLTKLKEFNSAGGTVETKKVLTLEASEMPTTNESALSQVGNVIFQLLGEEGYNSFSCNLTTANEDGTSTNDGEVKSMYRRINKTIQPSEAVNDTLEKVEFQPVDSNSLPEIPESLRDDQEIKYLLLEFKIFELCNFTSDDNHENWMENIFKKLTSCSVGISKLKMHVDGSAKIVLEKYSQDILKAAKKFKVFQESKMKIIKIINLTDYLSSTIKDSDIPKDLKNNFQELRQFLLVELKNEDLSLFHPDSNRKDVFMVQLFDYLIQSKIVDDKTKKLLEMFKKFIRNVS